MFNLFTVVELELEYGMFTSDNQANNCFWFDREIEKLSSHADDQKARDYMDISSANNTPNLELKSKLTVLRDSQVSQMVKDNVWLLYS